MTRTLVSVVSLALVACSAPTEPLSIARSGMQSLRLVNRTTEPIYYFAVEAGAAAMINWAPCAHPVSCKHVAAHGESALPYDQIAFYTPAAQHVIVYWWHLRSDGSSFRPDSIRASGADL